MMEDGDTLAPDLVGLADACQDLLARIADVMAEAEFQGFSVGKLFVLRRGEGHAVIARVAPGEFFHEHGGRTSPGTPSPCWGCGSPDLREGHGDGCLMEAVLEADGP